MPNDKYKQRIYKGMALDILDYPPVSIIDYDRNKKLYAAVQDFDRPTISEEAKGDGYQYQELKFTEFSPDLTKFVYTYYLHDYPHARIYDPFAGRGTRGLMAYVLGYNYTGVDLMQATVDSNIKRLEEMREGRRAINPNYTDDLDITFIRGDSTNPNTTAGLQPHSYDFAFSCPPYWDLEVYSDDPADLSNCKTYAAFLGRMAEGFAATYRLLKPNSFCVFVANYFRHEGEFYHLARALANLGVQAGFAYYDEYVINLRSPRALRTLGQSFQHYVTAKSHEYVEVLYKRADAGGMYLTTPDITQQGNHISPAGETPAPAAKVEAPPIMVKADDREAGSGLGQMPDATTPAREVQISPPAKKAYMLKSVPDIMLPSGAKLTEAYEGKIKLVSPQDMDYLKQMHVAAEIANATQ